MKYFLMKQIINILEKIYDSNDSDETTKYKIFKINYGELK